MKKKLSLIIFSFVWLFAMTISTLQNSVKAETWGAFEVTITPRGTVAANTDVVFDVTVKNIMDKSATGYVRVFYDAAWHSDIPSVDFGTMTDENGNIVTDQNSIVFQPNKVHKFVVKGTIPERWNKIDKSAITVVVSASTTNTSDYDYMSQNAYPRDYAMDEAEDYYSDDGEIRYQLLDDKNIIITAFLGDRKEVHIPQTIDGLTVKEIGDRAFSQTDNGYKAEVVTLPDTISKIGVEVFEACDLKEINIPKSVTEIGENAFLNCLNLTLKVHDQSYGLEYAKANGLDYQIIDQKIDETSQEITVVPDSQVESIQIDTAALQQLGKDIPQAIKDKYGNQDLDIAVVVRDEVASKDKLNIEKSVKEKGQNISSLFDISILINQNKNTVGFIEETNQKIKFTVDIPKEDLNYDDTKLERSFTVLRDHEGEITELPTVVKDGKVIFETDKFSTYALVYTDKVIQSSNIVDNDVKNPQGISENKPTAVETSDNKNIALYILVGSMSLFAGICLLKKRND